MAPRIVKEGLYDRLERSRRMLGLDKEATLDEIKTAFRDRLKRWHPDTARGDTGVHEEKTREIVKAYREIMDYCGRFRVSFMKDTVNRYRSDEECWWERFGDGSP